MVCNTQLTCEETVDVENESLATAIVREIASTTGVEMGSIPPLYNSIDPDALESLFGTTHGLGSRCGYVVFEHAGCRIKVDSDGHLEVSEQETEARRP